VPISTPPIRPTPGLSDAQRWALELAETHGWGVAVETTDGERVSLCHGRPAYGLVLFLSAPPATPVPPALPTPPATPTPCALVALLPLPPLT